MAKPRRLLLAALLGIQALSGCLSAPTGPSQPASAAQGSAAAGESAVGGVLASAWRFKPTPQYEPRGVATHPTTGAVYFTTRYGVTVLNPDGSSLGYQETRRLDGHRSAIGAPLVSPDGRSVFFSDYQQLIQLGLYSLETGSRKLSKLPFDTNSPIAVEASIGITAEAALSGDGGRVYLPSGDLYVYDLATGARTERHAVGGQARQIVRLDGERFLVNLTQPGDVRGALVVFDAAGTTGETLSYPYPIQAIAARPDWIVAIAQLAEDRFQLVELKADDHGALTATPGPSISLTGNGDPLELSLALRPGHQQVAIGRSGPYPAGGTRLVDARSGASAAAETKDVAGLAFAPDGRALYVAHTLYPDITCLDAFVVP